MKTSWYVCGMLLLCIGASLFVESGRAGNVPVPVIYDPLDGSTLGTLEKGATDPGYATFVSALHGEGLFLNEAVSTTGKRVAYNFTTYPSSTIMFWVKPAFDWETNVTDQQWILGSKTPSNDPFLYRNTNVNGLNIEWSWGIYGTAPTGTFTNWFHIACVFSNINVPGPAGTRVVKMYINGVQKLSYNDTSTTRPQITAWRVGGADHRSMEATVDEILFFGEALDAVQVKDIYTRTKLGGKSFRDAFAPGTTLLIR